MKTNLLLVCLASAAFCIRCSNTTTTERTRFTKADSLTETYLSLQDSIHHAWNMVMKDENERLKSLQATLAHLQTSLQENEQIRSLHEQLEQLKRMRITPKTLSNPHVIQEYDFACSTLVSELSAFTESSTSLLADKRVKELLNKVRVSDQRLQEYRTAYDSLAVQFNAFVEKNKSILKDSDKNSGFHKRPLFSR